MRRVFDHKRELASQWARSCRSPARSAAHRRRCTRGAPNGDRPQAGAGQRDLEEGVSSVRPSGAGPPTEETPTFIDAHREEYGVEPICEVLPIAPSPYHGHERRERDPSRQPERAHHRRSVERGDQAGGGGEPAGVRSADGVAEAQARGDQSSAVDGGAVGAEDGACGCCPGEEDPDDDPREGPGASGGSCRARLHGPPGPTSWRWPTCPTWLPGWGSCTWRS